MADAALAVIQPRKQNKTEAAYDAMLARRLHAGEIERYAFEEVTLKLGFDVRFTPDFLVVLANREVEFHEVKGAFIREDAIAKLRTAAYRFPFRFILAQKKEDGWHIKPVAPQAKEVMPNATVPDLQPKPKQVPNTRLDVTPPREVSRRASAARATEAQIAAWRPGLPPPPGYAQLGPRLVTFEYALELARKA